MSEGNGEIGKVGGGGTGGGVPLRLLKVLKGLRAEAFPERKPRKKP